MKLRRSRTEINLLKEQVEVLSNATAGGSEEIIIGDSPVMQQVFSTVEKLRDTDANILTVSYTHLGSCYGYCYGKQVECQRGFVGKILQIEGNGNP